MNLKTYECLESYKYHFFYIVVFILLTTTHSIWADTNRENSALISEADRRQILLSVSKNAMMPMFDELDQTSVKLRDRVKAFCEVKTKLSFQELREAWIALALAWQQSDSLLFGPTVDDNIDFTVYFLPVKKAMIKELLKRDGLTINDVDEAGVGAQGLGSLEYVLFSRNLSPSEIFTNFKADTKGCHYILKTTELLHQNINTIAIQWKHYGKQFGIAGNNSLYFFESKEALVILVNKIYQSAQKVSSKKVGILKNKQSLKKSAPYKLQAWRSGTSLAQIKANVMGIERLLKDGKILSWLENNHKTDVAEDIQQTIQQILKQTVPDDDLFLALQASDTNLHALVENTNKLTKLINTKLASSLDVQLGFNDNDGD